jgi:ankyrin repeat protein
MTSTHDWYGNAEIHHLALDSSVTALRTALEKHPEEVKTRNQFGRIPLHYALDKKSGTVNVEAVRFLVQQYPQGVTERDNDGFNPYDVAVKWGHSAAILKVLLGADRTLDPNAARRLQYGVLFYFVSLCQESPPIYKYNRPETQGQDSPDWYNNNDIHHAFGSDDLSPARLRRLIAANPSGLRHKNQFGRIPLHYALDRKSTVVSPAVVKVLAEAYPEGVAVKDIDDLSPYDLAKKWRHPFAVRWVLLKNNPAVDPLAYNRMRFGPIVSWLLNKDRSGRYD